MTRKNLKHTFESIKLAAENYENRVAFKIGSPNEYQAAQRLNILDQICENMPYVLKFPSYHKMMHSPETIQKAKDTGPVFTYLVLIKMKGEYFYKFGQSVSVDSRRSAYNLNYDDIKCTDTVITKEHTNLYDAMHYEKEMMESNYHRKFIPPLKTNGKPCGGHTECFSEFNIDGNTYTIKDGELRKVTVDTNYLLCVV